MVWPVAVVVGWVALGLCIPTTTSALKWSRWPALLALIFDNGVAGVPVKPG